MFQRFKEVCLNGIPQEIDLERFISEDSNTLEDVNSIYYSHKQLYAYLSVNHLVMIIMCYLIFDYNNIDRLMEHLENIM